MKETHPFDSPRLTLERAKHHICDLKQVVQTFTDESPFSFVVNSETQAPKKVHKVKFNKRPPADAACIVFDAVNNLRATLDQLGYSAAIASGKIDPPCVAYWNVCHTKRAGTNMQVCFLLLCYLADGQMVSDIYLGLQKSYFRMNRIIRLFAQLARLAVKGSSRCNIADRRQVGGERHDDVAVAAAQWRLVPRHRRAPAAPRAPATCQPVGRSEVYSRSTARSLVDHSFSIDNIFYQKYIAGQNPPASVRDYCSGAYTRLGTCWRTVWRRLLQDYTGGFLSTICQNLEKNSVASFD